MAEKHSRRWVIAAGIGVGAASLAGLGLVLRRPSTAAVGDERPITTAQITREDLVELKTVPGKLAYGSEELVASRLSGTVTALPAVGEVVDRGKPLFRIDDQPVIVLFGALPAFRELTAGKAADPAAVPPVAAVPATKGKDVKQFKENLRALGYSGLTVDESYTAQTATVVRRWQKDLGLAQTGVVELGRVFYTAGPVRVASQKLAKGAEATGPVLAVTGTARMVVATIKSYDQQLAKAGTKAMVEVASGKQIAATVQAVNTPADEEAAGGPDPQLAATLTLDDPASVDGIEDGPVRVRIKVQERKGVLVVPVGALLALAEGGFGLQVLDGGANRYVAVSTGLFAGGKVEVSGPDIAEGLTVGMAQ